MQIINIGIVGSRSFNSYHVVKVLIDEYRKQHNLINIDHIKIISGGANGADSLGKQYAITNNIELIEYLPNWDKYGKRAGMIRNRDIWKKSNVIFVFWDGYSKGTEDTILNCDKPLIIYNDLTKEINIRNS